MSEVSIMDEVGSLRIKTKDLPKIYRTVEVYIETQETETNEAVIHAAKNFLDLIENHDHTELDMYLTENEVIFLSNLVGEDI